LESHGLFNGAGNAKQAPSANYKHASPEIQAVAAQQPHILHFIENSCKILTRLASQLSIDVKGLYTIYTNVKHLVTQEY